jgi:hypothetical protein
LLAKARAICANIQTSRRSLSLVARRVVVEHAALVELHAERSAEEERRVLERGAEVRRDLAQARAQIVLGRAGVGGREVVLERAPHLEAEVRREASERALDRDEAVALGVELVEARDDVGRGDAEEIALVAVGEERARAAAEVARERARVAAEDGDDEVGAARDATVGVIDDDRVDEPEVAEHAEEGEERERDESVRLLAGHALDELQDLRGGDAIELGSELERRERVEVRALRDLAHGRREARVEEAEVDALDAEQAADHLDDVREAMAEHEEARLGGLLPERRVHEARARRVLREHRLEVALEDVRPVAFAEHGARELDDARHAVARVLQVLVKVVADDRVAARGAGVVPRVREARDALEEDLELEERLFLLVRGELGEPRLARLLLLAPEPPRVAQELGVRVAPGRARRALQKRSVARRQEWRASYVPCDAGRVSGAL